MTDAPANQGRDFCGNGTRKLEVALGSVTGDVDWNRNNLTDPGTVTATISCYTLAAQPLLAGANDWSRVDLQQVDGRGTAYEKPLVSQDMSISLGIAAGPWPPAGLNFNLAPGVVQLAWIPIQLSNLVSYNVYRVQGGVAQLAGSTTGTNGATPPAAFVDSGLPTGTVASYYVTSVDDYGVESTPSKSVTLTAGNFSPCDVNQDGKFTVADAQLMINQLLGNTPAVNDLNGDGMVNVLDFQIVVNAVLRLGCSAQ